VCLLVAVGCRTEKAAAKQIAMEAMAICRMAIIV